MNKFTFEINLIILKVGHYSHCGYSSLLGKDIGSTVVGVLNF